MKATNTLQSQHVIPLGVEYCPCEALCCTIPVWYKLAFLAVYCLNWSVTKLLDLESGDLSSNYSFRP